MRLGHTTGSGLLLAVALLGWMLSLSQSLEAGHYTLSGYYKSYFTALREPELGSIPGFSTGDFRGSVSNRLRVKLQNKASNWLNLTAAYDLTPKVQDSDLFSSSILIGSVEISDYRATDLRARLYPEDEESLKSFAVYQNLDRAFLTIAVPAADIYLGRQAIAWGSAHAVNPTDALAPFAYTELDIEDRRGVDAARVRIPLGFMGEIDAGYVAGDDFDLNNSALFLRSKFYYLRTDISLLLVEFRENLLLGFDFTRALGGAGAWIEGAYTVVDESAEENYFRLSTGFDYSLPDGTYLFAEYHYNQAGASDPDQYLDLVNRTAFTKGGVYLLGKHYLIAGALRQMTGLLSLKGEALANLSDRSLLFAPGVEYNIAENIYLAGGAYLGLGRDPSFNPDKEGDWGLQLHSEFGSYVDVFYSSFRVYF